VELVTLLLIIYSVTFILLCVVAKFWAAELSGFEFRWGQDSSPLRVVQTGSGAHPASYRIGTGALSKGVKWQEPEADHLPPTSAEVKNT
jgi:hypothetical protein